MKRFLLLTALTLAVNVSWAQIPSGYYDSAEGKTGTDLRAALHDIIKGHHDVGYSGLWTAYATTDCDANGKIIDIYSKYNWTYGSQQCGSYSVEGDCYNREHTWPQSWFGSGTPKSDLFHIYPTDGKVNGERSNYPFAKVKDPTYTSTNGSKLGTSTTSGYSGTAFEPIDEYKGDIARSFFYMSTRYYTEDSGWSSSAMTNKCEILPWALTMLLEWHVQDPVSEKEIARNNAVYGYQNNRNPFIDHPEYAQMIWDENWQPGNSYAITTMQSTGGTVSAPSSATEGSTVAITATPDVGYAVSGYNAYKTGSPSTTVSVSSDGTFTMPAYAVTVSASFERNTTYYALTKGYEVNGSISLSATQALAGTTITVSTTPETGYKLFAIYVYKTGDASINVPVTDNSFVMPAFNVTVSATFVEEGSSSGGTGDFVKVTSAPQDWSGEYLIVYENGNVAFDGGLSTLDATNNTIAVTISNNTIAATDDTNAATFTIAPMTDGYSIMAKSGKYIGQATDANGLTSSDSPLLNTLSYDNGDINIVCSGKPHLRYNANSGQYRFRYFKSSTYSQQQAIQLYKRESVAEPVYHTITFQNNDGQTYTQEVEEFVPTALIPNTFTREGFVFDGWRDINGTYYADCAEVTLLDDLTLYSQWNELFDITLVQPAHGTISASATTATEETDIELTATPEEGYQFSNWVVTNAEGTSITVYDNTFEMPASDVTVTATFVYVGEPSGDAYYQLVTSTDQLVAGKKYLIVNTDASKALSTTQNSNNRAATDVTINSDNTITTIGDACELTLGGSTGAWTFYDSNKGGYLYAASSSSNWLRTQATNDDNGKWSITIASDGTATIKAQGDNTRNQLRYNNSTTNGNLFSCYSSGQQPVSLFVRVEPQAITIGDVNKDGFITIADVTALVNIILGKDDDEPQQYNHVAADVNDDGSITIADVTALVNIILGKNN